MAHLYLGYNLFIEFCIAQEVLSEEEGAILAKEAWETLSLISERQSEVLRDQQPVHKFFDILQDLLDQKRVYLADLENNIPAGAEHLAPDKKIGWEGDGTIFLSMDSAFREVYQYCKLQGEIFPVQKTTLIKHIKQLSLQTQGQDRGRKIQKRFGTERARVLPIASQILGVE